MTGNCNAGTLALNVLTNQMLANSQIAQTLLDDQYGDRVVEN